MTIAEIKAGKKYYLRRRQPGSRKTHVVVIGIPVFVLEVDLRGNRVLASIGGSPAEWLSKSRVATWSTEDPTLTMKK